MNIQDFIANFHNHPVLFIGTGMSLRYLNNSYTWDDLLNKVSSDFIGNNEYYLDVKSKCENGGSYDYPKIASIIEKDFNDHLLKNRNGTFKHINDTFYENMEAGRNLSRFKIYLSEILGEIEINDEKRDEIKELRKIRKNIASIITTNYDYFIEKVFQFNPLIGNDILLSNPYGAVYKIHGCVSDPSKIIITEEDYAFFKQKYELIRAQLLSIFIHNPIIFIGYAIGDDNIKSLLKTIFSYVQPNSEQSRKIRENFLLVEYEKGSTSKTITEHDIDLEGFSTIRINKIKTDDYVSIYKPLSDLTLPVSAMDIRKVQNVVKEIYSGGDIKVSITEDLDALDNSDKIIAIGSHNTISYQYQSVSEIISNYFTIIDESNEQLLELVNKHTIQTSQYFPIFAFSEINTDIEETERLKNQQEEKINAALERVHDSCKSDNSSIDEIL
ncbi:MAG: SIR2 family protein, partial [Candidatus Paceibacterota bacterium]